MGDRCCWGEVKKATIIELFPSLALRGDVPLGSDWML